MSQLVWSEEAELQLLALAPSAAEEVLVAMENFAGTGRGFIRAMADGSGEQRLYLRRVYVAFDHREHTVRALRVVRF